MLDLQILKYFNNYHIDPGKYPKMSVMTNLDILEHIDDEKHFMLHCEINSNLKLLYIHFIFCHKLFTSFFKTINI